MTRKHFVKIAEGLGRDYEVNTDITLPFSITEIDVEDHYGYLLAALAECNPAFDRDRFIQAVMDSAIAARENVMAQA